MFVVGVDGCRAGWIAVAFNDGTFAGAACFDTFGEVIEALPEAVAIGVDIPIGMLPDSMRVCDALTREYVGPRRASVFLTPPRPAIEAESYEEAGEICLALTGRGLSKQAYSLRSKILEVDNVVRSEGVVEAGVDSREAIIDKPESHPARVLAARKESRESLRRHARIIEPDGGHKVRMAEDLPGGRIIEVHPEASFRRLAGEPLRHNKLSRNGVLLRTRLLEDAGIAVPLKLQEIGGVDVDDVLDAAVVAWTANRYANKEARSLPTRELWQFDGDRVVATWI